MTSSWFYGEPQIATEGNIKFWNDKPRGRQFRCYLCGYSFQLGDYWRYVYDNGTMKGIPASGANQGNFMVCKNCDCDNIREKWLEHCKDIPTKYWWLEPFYS